MKLMGLKPTTNGKRKIIALLLICCVFFTYKTYKANTFNIENYMIKSKYRGSVEKHNEAKKSGSLQYCNNYAIVRSGGPSSRYFSTAYYRVSDGRLYSLSGSYLCPNLSITTPIDIIKSKVSGYERPLKCNYTPKDIKCPESCPGIQCAIKYNEINSLKRLIDSGEDVNATRSNMLNDSMLGFAIYNRNYDIIKMLVENGANIKIGRAHV